MTKFTLVGMAAFLSRNGVPAHPQPVDHPLLVYPSAARQFTGNDQAHDLFIDPFAQSFFT